MSSLFHLDDILQRRVRFLIVTIGESFMGLVRKSFMTHGVVGIFFQYASPHTALEQCEMKYFAWKHTTTSGLGIKLRICWLWMQHSNHLTTGKETEQILKSILFNTLVILHVHILDWCLFINSRRREGEELNSECKKSEKILHDISINTFLSIFH